MIKVYQIKAGMIVKDQTSTRSIKVTRDVRPPSEASNCVLHVTGINPDTGERDGFATFYWTTVERVS